MKANKKILILTNLYSITGASSLASLLKENQNIVEVITVQGTIKKKTPTQFLTYAIKKEGVKYLYNKLKLGTKTKIRAKFSKFIHNNNNNEIYYSINEVKKIYNFKHKIVKDINDPKVIEHIKNLDIDLLISLSFSYIIKPDILQIPKIASINLHRSYLPKYRGCNPVFWVRAFKEKETGYTFHYLNEELDKGDIIFQEKIPLYEKNTNTDIMIRMSKKIVKTINPIVNSVIEGTAPRIRQNEEEASYFKCPTKEDRLKYNIWD
ncbi:MAG: hypothetical protein GXO22_00185 [Aquificae bacterium]|nr:hypothetical protein [Aquificota bacterium]